MTRSHYSPGPHGPTPEPVRSRLSAQLAAVVIASYAHVFLEWLFFITKTSPLAAMDWFERLTVLLVTPLPLAALGCAIVLTVGSLSRALGYRVVARVVRSVGWTPSAAVLAVCVFILVDNFTYTLFSFGVGSTTGPQRTIYAVLVGGLFVRAWQRLGAWDRRSQGKQAGRAATLLACSLVLTSTVTAALQYLSTAHTPPTPLVAESGATARKKLPNIIIFNTDGLEAAHMSAYGYERETTPTIAQIADESLVFENALYNGGHTTASNAAILTGKFALTTGILSYGQILTGAHAYQHLPGILRRLGYQSMYMGMRSYGDPYNLNMRDGFDSATGRGFKGERTLPSLPRGLALAYSSELYFLTQLYWRAAERLQHAVGGEPMVNPLLAVKKRTKGWNDERRVAETLSYIEKSRGPFFVHVHLMGTHPPLKPRVDVFSSKAGDGNGKTKRVIDAYDNAILEFDGYVGQLLDTLEHTRKLNSTLLIISSDHGRNWSHRRLPLIMRFPSGAPRGAIKANAQLIDIAPTILDHLGVGIPAWMEGRSLISSTLKPGHPIFGMTAKDKGTRTKLASVTVTVRDHVFGLDTATGEMSLTRIPGHTAPLAPAERPSTASMKALLLEQLRRNGFENEYSRALAVSPAEPRRDSDER